MKLTRFHLKTALAVGAFFLLLLFFSLGMDHISSRTAAEQKKSLEEALHRSIVCYYISYGVYPESLEELLESAPLLYDENLFTIRYQPIAANLMPDVTVIERENTH